VCFWGTRWYTPSGLRTQPIPDAPHSMDLLKRVKTPSDLPLFRKWASDAIGGAFRLGQKTSIPRLHAGPWCKHWHDRAFTMREPAARPHLWDAGGF
jgi:hypothetical protein